MRLLNVFNGHIEEFAGSYAPRYAILSHTWETQELGFRDIPVNTQPDPVYDSMFSIREDVRKANFSAAHSHHIQRKAGYFKVTKSCEQAFHDRLAFVWIDTCCIDKTSSAELSESINSMYKWYQMAEVCYAYLQDVYGNNTTDFIVSRWFTRGWTLQELLAPSKIQFFDRAWTDLGDRASLVSELQQATRIDQSILLHHYPIHEVSVARRMCWASKRITTRVEDRAYSLLGLFGVNMPLLYGEGEKAFIRLQEEIIRGSNDQTIFAWGIGTHLADYFGHNPQTPTPLSNTELLAPSPRLFADSHRVTRLGSTSHGEAHAVTNVGLSIKLPLIRHTYKNLDFFVGVIGSRLDQSEWFECLGIVLLQYQNSSTYRRVNVVPGVSCVRCDVREAATSPETIYISKGSYNVHPSFLWSLDYRAIVDRAYYLINLRELGSEVNLDPSATRQVITGYRLSPLYDHELFLVFYNTNIGQGFIVSCVASSIYALPSIRISAASEDIFPGKPFGKWSLRGWFSEMDSKSLCEDLSMLLPFVTRGGSHSMQPEKRGVATFGLKVCCVKEEVLGQPVFVVRFEDAQLDEAEMEPQSGNGHMDDQSG